MEEPDAAELEWLAMQQDDELLGNDDEDMLMENVQQPAASTSGGPSIALPEDDTSWVPPLAAFFEMQHQNASRHEFPRENVVRIDPTREYQHNAQANQLYRRAADFSGGFRPEEDFTWVLPPPPPFSEIQHRTASRHEPPRDNEFRVEPGREFQRRTEPNQLYRRAADIAGGFLPVTGPCGKRVYAAITRDDFTDTNLTTFGNKGSLGLLSVSIHTLLARLEEESSLQVVTAAEASEISVRDDTGLSKELDQLWVDKYAPKMFTDLLSDEQINREVLQWLKQWDTCVFGKKARSVASVQHSGLEQERWKPERLTGGHGMSKRTSSFQQFGKADKAAYHGERKTPGQESLHQKPQSSAFEKILLLSGPPGLGKTTLAHVAAKHCGYRVVEINASDDRAGATLQSKIFDALQMRSVLGDGRPNCLVIDEIDGSLGGREGKSAIDSVLSLIAAESKSQEDATDESKPASTKPKERKKGAPALKLSRPVICICNDLYAPALRNIRQVARIERFIQPGLSRVVTRLKQICSEEGYATNPRALTLLAEHTECDIRSCLHTLQFLHQKGQPLNMVDVASQLTGRKNMTHNIFKMWREVFQSGTKRSRAGSWGPSNTKSGGGTEKVEFQRLYDIFSNHGDFDLGFEGVFENLLQMRSHDTSMRKLVECLNILGTSDVVEHRAVSRQHFFLHAYQPSNFLAVRRLIAQPEMPHIVWPKLYQSFKRGVGLKREMLQDWLLCMSVAARRTYSIRTLTEDLISPLLAALSPRRLRTVSYHMFTKDEKDEVKGLVGSMLRYGITYKQSNSGKGSERVAFHMHPPINSLITFQGYLPQYCPLSDSLRQMLSHESRCTVPENGSMPQANMERIRQRAGVSSSEEQERPDILKQGPEASSFGTPVAQDTTSAREKAKKQEVKNPPASQTNGRKRPAQDATSVFDRWRIQPKDPTKTNVVKLSTAQRDSRPIVFKYQEGFTSAIKRPMYVREFLS